MARIGSWYPDADEFVECSISFSSVLVGQVGVPGCLTLDAMKRQLHAQFTDATLNSPKTVLRTLYQDFVWAAHRMHAYADSMRDRRPTAALMMKTIFDLGEMAFSIINSRSKLKDDVGYTCHVTSRELQW